MKTIPLTAAAAASLLAVMAPAQQEMTPLFRHNANESLEWFRDDGYTRGMALLPDGSLLVPDRGGTNAVYRLDPVTGEQAGRISTSATSGGTFVINKIAVSDDGKIWLANMATSGSPFKIYYYDTPDSTPALAFEMERFSGRRIGDGFAVTGSGASTRMLVTGSDNTVVYIITDPDGDGVFQGREVTPTRPEIGGVQEAAWDRGGATFWLRQSSSGNMSANEHSAVDGAGTGRRMAPGANYGPIGIDYSNGTMYMALGPGVMATNSVRIPGLVYSSQSPEEPVFQTSEGLEYPGGAKDNINGAGEAIVDYENGRVYYLLSNNSISGWQLP